MSVEPFYADESDCDPDPWGEPGSREWYIAYARDQIARWEALTAADHRAWAAAPAVVRVPPARLLELLGEAPDGQGALAL